MAKREKVRQAFFDRAVMKRAEREQLHRAATQPALLAACKAARQWPMPDDCHAACGTCTGCLLRAAIEAAEQERA